MLRIGTVRSSGYESISAQNPSITCVAVILRLLIETSQRIYHLIEPDSAPCPWCTPQARGCLDSTGIRCPRRENSSLFIQRKVRIVDDVCRTIECLSRMQQLTEIEPVISRIVDTFCKALLVHALPPKLKGSGPSSPRSDHLLWQALGDLRVLDGLEFVRA